MSKQLGIIIGVIILLAVGGLAYVQFGGKLTKPTETSNTATDNNQEEGTIKGTIASLLSGDKNVTCAINDFGSEEGGQGVVFVSGKNIRGDFSSLENGKRVFSHLIQNGGTTYFWGDAMPNGGVKMKIDLQAEVKDLPEAQAQAMDLNKEFNYSCVNWTVDNSVFNPPTDVKFTDMTSLMDSMKAKATGAPTGSGYSGFSCEGITDASAKAACENAMKQ